jgi:hypothetical protein
MPRATADKAYVNFIGGLITEANPLAVPDGAAVDLDNIDLQNDGSIRRRLGIDFEDGYVDRDVGDQEDVNFIGMSVHRWKAVSQLGERDFTVVQMGSKLDIYDTTEEILSADLLDTLDISTHAVTPSSGKRSVLQSAYGKGRLFMVGRGTDPFYIEYDADSNTFSTTEILIQMRDFDRLDDGLAIEERPTTLSPEHEYNLKNQGWSQANYTTYRNSQGKYPSNADVMSAGKDSNGNFSAGTLNQQFFGNTAAANGHFILDAFLRNRNLLSGANNLPIEIETNRPESVTFFSGRVWYSGLDSTKLNGHIFFSQVLEDLQLGNAGKCYQEQDPTAEEFNELLDTDGGTIIIPEAGKIHGIIAFGGSVIVFGANGVWQITGTDSGFTASSYSVNKISEFGANSVGGIISAESLVLYWSEGGIYAVGADPNSVNALVSTDITRDTIRGFYLNIPRTALGALSSFYDSTAKKVYWFYNDSTGYLGILFRHNVNKALILDLSTPSPAFVKYSMPYEQGVIPGVAGAAYHKNSINTLVTDNVVVNSDQVVVNGDEVVVTEIASVERIDYVHCLVVYVVGGDYKYTFALFRDRNFQDWASYDDPILYTSFIQSGFENLGDLMRKKMAVFCYSYFEKTESGFTSISPIEYQKPSGCLFQSRWDWHGTDTGGKWSVPQNAYRFTKPYTPVDIDDVFDDGNTLVQTRLKVRGHGKSVSFRWSSVPNKDFRLLGWSVPYTAGAALQ